MIRAGMRELRQLTSVLIRQVINGETIEVTQRGRPVARIVPVPSSSVLDLMVMEGRATIAHGNLLDVKPIPWVARKPHLSEALAKMRADER